MRPPHDVYRFGSFELNPATRRLTRGHQHIDISERQFAILLCLVEHAGEVVPRDVLIKAAWPDGIATDESLAQMIKLLRRALGRQRDRSRYITTAKGHGFGFAAQVRRGQPRESQIEIDEQIAPHCRFTNGRSAIEMFDLHALPGAELAFAAVLRIAPDYAPAHIGLANVHLLKYESTRVDLAPDLVALGQADHHARLACSLDRDSGDASATVGLVLRRLGRGYEAIGAGRQALALDSRNWCHDLRFAEVSWGEDRRLAARRVLRRRPGLALPHWFAGSLFIARQDLDAAIEEVLAGCALQDAQHADGRFNAVGLHLLYGLLLAARGALDEAIWHLMRELALLDDRHVYARESGANAWCAIGALERRRGRMDDATAAFRQTLTRVPTHPLARVGLGAIAGVLFIPPELQEPKTVNAAMVKAAILSCQEQHEEAGRVCQVPLEQAEPGSAGWMLPVEPLINVAAHPEAWAKTLAILRDRAW